MLPYQWRKIGYDVVDNTINLGRACAARVTVVSLSVCVCVCVCRCLFCHYRLRGGLLAIPAASELREPEK